MEQAPGPRKRGCLFYGCISFVVLTIVLIVGIFFTLRYALNKAKSFTDTQPAALEVVEMSEPERAAVQQRVDEFKDGIENGRPVQTLVLTERELNALIAGDPTWRGKIHLDLDGDEMKAKMAVPLDMFNIRPLRGRFFNGEATLKVSVENGELMVRTTKISAKGQPVPDALLKDVKNQNWAEKSVRGDSMKRIENVEIKDEKLIITPKAQ